MVVPEGHWHRRIMTKSMLLFFAELSKSQVYGDEMLSTSSVNHKTSLLLKPSEALLALGGVLATHDLFRGGALRN